MALAMDSQLFYYVIVLIGLVMIWQHASIQFEQPIKVDVHRRYEILNDLEISSLASEDTLKLGKLIYVGTYVLIYVLALIFWDNVAEVFQLDNTTEGARGTPAFLEVTHERLGRPLAVAATLMSLLAVGGQLAEYEEPVRRFAHRRAGIPRGVYRIARLLNTLSYSTIAVGQSTPTLQRFKEKIANLREAGCKIDSDSVEKIEKQLQKIDLLSPAVIGNQRDYTFDFPKIDALSKRIDKLSNDVRALDVNVTSLNEHNCNITEILTLSDQILKQENNVVAMFAVLYLNTKGFNTHNIPSPTSDILKNVGAIRKTYEFPAIIWSAAATILFSVFFYFVVQRFSLMLKDGEGWKTFLSAKQMTTAANWSMRSLVEHVLLVLTVSSIAILNRQETIDQDSWPLSFPRNQPPIGQYLLSAAAPALVGSTLLIILLEVEGLYDQSGTGDYLSLDKLWTTMDINYIYVIGAFITSIILIVGVFFISDLHNKIDPLNTSWISVISGFILFLVALGTFEIMHSFDQRLAITDTAKISVFVVIFLLLYARAIKFYDPRQLGEARETYLISTTVDT